MITNKSNQTLIVILAETRAHELTFDLFEENFQKVLNADLALCVGNNKNTNKHHNKFYENSKFIWEIEEPDTAENLYDEVSKKNNYGEEWKNILRESEGIAFSKLFTTDNPAVSFLYYFRWLLLQNIISHNLLQTYQWFVVTRSDFMWKIPHPKCEYLNPEHIYVPDGQHYRGINDRHIIISNKYIEKSLGILDYILNHPREMLDAGNNIEMLLKHYFKQAGIYNRIYMYPYTMYTVRTKDGPGVWKRGTYDESLGYCIKYKEEYESYLKYSTLIKCQEDWEGYLENKE